MVTGGAGAIGTAIVEALQQQGHHVVVVDRDSEFAADLGSEQSTRRVGAAILARYGRCDVFVHAAAAFDLAALSDLSADTWRHVQAVNVESALWLAQAFVPGMASRRFGRIVFVTSDTLWDPPAPMLLPYGPAKGRSSALCGFWPARSGRTASRQRPVAPGLIDTPASRTVNTDEDFWEVIDRQALKRRLTPADTAAAAAFLASAAAAAMTGQVLCVDGGLVLR